MSQEVDWSRSTHMTSYTVYISDLDSLTDLGRKEKLEWAKEYAREKFMNDEIIVGITDMKNLEKN